MCGGGGNKTASQSQSQNGKWGGLGWGHMGGTFGANTIRGSQVAAENKARQEAREAEAKESKLGEKTEAGETTSVPGVFGGLTGPNPAVPVTSLNEMDQDLREGKKVNMGAYNKQSVFASHWGQMFADYRDAVKASREMSSHGDFVQNEDKMNENTERNAQIMGVEDVRSLRDRAVAAGHQEISSLMNDRESQIMGQARGVASLNVMDMEFEPNRGITGTIADVITGTNRTLPMRSAVREQRHGRAKDVAGALSAGSRHVSEHGMPVKSVFSGLMDVAKIGSNLFSMGPLGMLGLASDIYDFAENRSREERLDAPLGSRDEVTAKQKQGKVSRGAVSAAGSAGGGDGQRLMTGVASKAAETEEKAGVPVSKVAARTRRGRSTLIRTGGMGLEDRPRILMTGLSGGKR